MKTYICSFIAIFAISSSTCAGGEFARELVPASVKWLVHIDLDQARGTQVGEYIQNELSKGEADRKLSALSTILRFDPRKDLMGITMFGQNDQPESAAVVLDGTFDAEALATMIKGNDDYSSTAHGAHTIHGWVDKGKRSYGTVMAEKMVISQGLDLVRQTLDVMDGGKSHLPVNSPLTPGSGFFSAAADMQAVGTIEAKAAMLKKADVVNVSVSETGRHVKGNLTITAENQEVSDQLMSLVQGMIAFAELNGEESPELLQLAKSMNVDQNGNQIGVSVLLPIADILEMMEDNQGWKKEF